MFLTLGIQNFILEIMQRKDLKIFSSLNNTGKLWIIASPYFNAQTMMGTLPIQHYVSEALDNHVKGEVKIVKQTGKKPLHVNFV